LEETMADDDLDQSLTVDLNDDDTPPSSPPTDEKPVAAKPPPVPGPSTTPPPPPQVGLAELERQLTSERAERARVTETARQIAAERDQAIAFAQEAERRGVSTYELYNENQIRATQDKMEALAAQGEQAMQDGDFKRAQSINLQIGRLGGALAVLERDQAVLVQQREQMQQQPQRQPQRQQPQQPQQPQRPADPLERAIQGRTEPTKEFLRKHPDLVRGDGTLKRSAIDAHERALDDGYAVDTPAYFDYIERSLTAQVPAEVRGSVPAAGRAPTMAAPVARGGGPGSIGGGGSDTFTMTPKMRRLAAEQQVSEKEWARNYVRLLNEGRITPIT
jgi:hypothetical protein